MSESGFGLAACQHCGQHIEFPRDGMGQSVACPHCREETVLEEMTPAVPATPAPDELTAAELKAALAGIVPRQRVSIFYQFGLALVALFMVLLPLVYLAFVAGLAYATYWYGVHAWVMFLNPGVGHAARVSDPAD